jgi:hypothetical protein
MTKEWDRDYFGTEEQEAEREAVSTQCMAVGEHFLNFEEQELYAEMFQAITKCALDRVAIVDSDDETGAEVVKVPPLNEIEQELLALIHETYNPLIAEARAKGKINA